MPEQSTRVDIPTLHRKHAETCSCLHYEIPGLPLKAHCCQPDCPCRTEMFEGHVGRECGEHRTVGWYRAWCHDCSEWCYPEMPCKGCAMPNLRHLIRELHRLTWPPFDERTGRKDTAIDDVSDALMKAIGEDPSQPPLEASDV